MRNASIQTLTTRREPAKLVRLLPSVKVSAARPGVMPPKEPPMNRFPHIRALLVTWGAEGMTGVVATPAGWRNQKGFIFSRPATSNAADFGQALDDILKALQQQGIRPPKNLLLASGFIVPVQMDLPFPPEKPRPTAQMWELTLAETEAAVSEAGAVWTVGAILAARGRLSQQTREEVALELSLRRNASNAPIYFGKLACERGFITKQELDEALRLQEKLQGLESRLACGWVGKTVDEEPVWLAAATTLSNWKSWENALKARHMKLARAIPLALAVSETPGETKPRLALEIHAEEIVLVMRTEGRLKNCRTEARVGRALNADWLLALAQEWRTQDVETLEIVCLKTEDEAVLATMQDALTQGWSKPVLLRGVEAAHQGLYAGIARVWRDKNVFLPHIRYGSAPQPVWKKPAFWRLTAPLLTLCAIAGVHIQQQGEIKRIQNHFYTQDMESKRQALVRQQETQARAETQKAWEHLQSEREQLALLLPQVEQLSELERMTKQLPVLLRTIAHNIADDVVLNSIRSARGNLAAGQLQVTGWTSSYTSAQSFALAMQVALGGSYAVTGTEIKAAKGRSGHSGFQVVFWLLPSTEELNADAKPVAAVPSAEAEENPLPEQPPEVEPAP